MLTGQQPGPSHECLSPKGLAHIESFSGRGVLPGHGPRSPTEFAQRVLLPQAPHPGPRQGRSLAGICWGNVGGMRVVGPEANGEEPRSWWAGGHSLQQQKGRSVGAWKP